MNSGHKRQVTDHKKINHRGHGEQKVLELNNNKSCKEQIKNTEKAEGTEGNVLFSALVAKK